MSIPAVCIVGWADSGKTTLIEGLIKALCARGLRAGVVKHDVHGMNMDVEGKDTWRYARAGASVSAIVSTERAALIESRALSLNEMLARVADVDLILIEGFDKEACLPMIEVRRDAGAPLRAPAKWLRAVVTREGFEGGTPVFDPDDTESITELVLALAKEQNETPGRARVSVSVNGSALHMVPFVQRMLESVNRGLLGELDGYRENCDIEIRIDSARATSDNE